MRLRKLIMPGKDLSANLVGLDTNTRKFGRWGDGYAYHIGDLGAVVLPGHDPNAKTYISVLG